MHVKTKVATNGVANILALFSLSKSKPSLAKRKAIQLCLVATAFIAISTLLNHRFYYIADPLVYTNDALDSDQSVKESPWNNLGLSNPAVPEGRAKSNADSSDSASQVHEQKVPASPIPKPSSLRTSQSAESDNPACARFFSRMTAPGTHFLNSSGACESAGAQTVPQRIFFVHYNKQLENPRYLCAAESAARQNPAHSVTIYVKHRDQFEASVATWRQALGPDISGRVATEELDYADAFSETPLQTWWANRTYEKSSWVEQNLGNAFRLSKMWKHGGVYLDMDIISLNPVGAMGRSIAMQDSKRMNNAYFSLQRHDPFMMTLMTEFTSTFNGFAWGHNGPQMVTRAYDKACNNLDKQNHFGCHELSVAPTVRFFPVTFEERASLFDHWDKKCDLLQKLADESVAIHWWNKLTHATIMSNETTIAVIMQAACPSVFAAYTGEDLKIAPNGLVGERAYREDERKRPGF